MLRTFEDEYIPTLRNNQKAHVVMLIDFDDQGENRKAKFEVAIPDDIKARVFVVGSKDNPEVLRKLLNKPFEKIGDSLAGDCHDGTTTFWDHEQLRHNGAERERLVQIVKPFLF